MRMISIKNNILKIYLNILLSYF